MNSNVRSVTVLALTLMLAFSAAAKDKPKSPQEASPPAAPVVETSASLAPEPHSAHDMRGAMGAVFTAEKLYSCPMHAEIVSDSPADLCPLCQMPLAEMSAERMAQLRTGKPKGCPMCPVAVAEASPVENCPVCKMKLAPIEKTEAPLPHPEMYKPQTETAPAPVEQKDVGKQKHDRDKPKSDKKR